jgi:hypothetical protein
MPQPRVSPPTPVVEIMPPVVARPNGYVAAFRSPHVAPRHSSGVGQRVDPDTAHAEQVDHDSVVAGAEARDAMAAATHLDGQVVVGSEPDGRHHVSSVRRLHDHRRPPVDHAVTDSACLVVPGSRNGPPHPLTQGRDCGVVHAFLLE